MKSYKMESLDSVVDYLVDNGMDEGEVNHFLHQKLFKNKSIMEYVKDKRWPDVWHSVIAYVSGGDI